MANTFSGSADVVFMFAERNHQASRADQHRHLYSFARRLPILRALDPAVSVVPSFVSTLEPAGPS
jgi:hypothetical protein